MVLKECYYVCYHVADFSKDGESTLHEDPYRIYSNALAVAKELTKCLDVVDGNVCIVSGLTGEVLVEFSADEAIASTAEENGNAAINDNNSFEDGLGGVWRRDDEEPELWSYDCSGKSCNSCPYNWGAGPCYTEFLHADDVKDLIAEAKKQMGK